MSTLTIIGEFLQDGELGLNYWQGWQDAMIETQFGKKPFNSESTLK